MLSSFSLARYKLTGWYLLIIMLISFSFSVGIYKVSTDELERVEQRVLIRQEILQQGSQFVPPFSINLQQQGRLPNLNPDLFDESKSRIRLALIVVNIFILLASGAAGYFLAGRTLKPIQNMIEEQKQFISDASHELRTPLTVMRTELEVNLRGKDFTLQQAKEQMQSNLEEVNRLQKLSDSLIKITQVQKRLEMPNLNFEPLSLLGVTEEAVKRISTLARAKKINIDNQSEDIIVKGEKQSLIELFVILLDNAIKYSPANKKVTLSTKKIDGSVAVEVRDEGMGIAEEDIPHIFDRFYRADKSRTKGKVDGYGLGLSIAKEIVEKHKGSIKAESELNIGSVFTVNLPSSLSRINF